MKLKQIQAAIETLAPLSLAQDWDNVGLLLGDADAEVQSV
jgi:putative NIF3 family GTP cyclohydrolase 1 type 2